MLYKKQILWITQTAMLLGLTVATQYYLTALLSFNSYVSQLAVGSLVNLFLILSALMCGFLSGFSIGAIAPIIAFSLGRLPHVWIIPFAALGNIAIVFVFWLICGRKLFASKFTVNWAAASILGALLKFGVLWVGVTQIFINFILKNDASLKTMQIEKMTSSISFIFSFPQLATALLGSILVYALYPIIKKAIIEKPAKAKN